VLFRSRVAALHSFVGLAAVFIGLNADIMLSAIQDMKAAGLDREVIPPKISGDGFSQSLQQLL
jgi:NAD(P) transhydrogenase subunit beta